MPCFEELGDEYLLGKASDELADGRPPAQVRAIREQSAAAYRTADAEDDALKELAKPDEQPGWGNVGPTYT
ncbi:hypothetical protein [Kitasatospora sp. NPDC002965]|uniref:hypothetical protein n=1 Tax=Kitasatospora sp. NPDC002965 TaxID=3154775 RepID=UPI0033B3BDCC